MITYDYNNYGGYEGEIIIPASVVYNEKKYSVVSIGDRAFSGCSNLTSITIPNSVISIGDYAFNGCASLTSITIPNSVTSIGSGAFYQCTDLTSISLPENIENIGDEAFNDCKNLVSISLPEKIESKGHKSSLVVGHKNNPTTSILATIRMLLNMNFH